MNTCEDLIEQFKKSINSKNFKLKYDWNFNKRGYYYKSKIIGMYDNKICNMTIDEETKLLNEKSLKQICKCDTLYSNSLEMNVPTYCEINK